jgi:hypothetical protein
MSSLALILMHVFKPMGVNVVEGMAAICVMSVLCLMEAIIIEAKHLFAQSALIKC